MIKHNQDGAVDSVVLSLVVAVIVLIAALAFGGWAFSSRQDYKDHTDAKINAAVVIAKQQESSLKDKQFAEAEKNPLKAYDGPEAYGSIVLNYPKTWSGYVDDTGASSGGAQLDGYFNPDVVPSTSTQNSIFALHVQVLSQTYNQAVKSFSGTPPQGQTRTINAYALPKVPKVVGTIVSGALTNAKTGTVVILPLRSQTLEISTDGTQFASDFTNIILPNFSFSP